MHKKNSLILVTAAVVLLSACQSSPTKEEPAKQNLSTTEIETHRQAALDTSKKVLARLYENKPEAKAEIEAASGYGVFDITSLNALVLVGQKGKGVIFDNKTGAPTYMLTAKVGTGPGLGYQELYQVFVFKSDVALDQFKVGNSAGGDLNASVTAGTSGGQISFNPYIDVYQISNKGFAVQANWGGTAYMVDPDLN